MYKTVSANEIGKIYKDDMNSLGQKFRLQGTEKEYILLKLTNLQVRKYQSVNWDENYLLALTANGDKFCMGAVAADPAYTAGSTETVYIFAQCGGYGLIRAKDAATADGQTLMADSTPGMVVIAAVSTPPVLAELNVINASNAIAKADRATTDIQLTGTVHVNAGALTTLVGDGNCKFTKELLAADAIVIGSTAKVIDAGAITDDNSLAITVAMGGAVAAGTKIYLRVKTSKCLFQSKY